MTSIETLKLAKYVNIAYYLRAQPIKFHINKKDNIITFHNTCVLDNLLDEVLYYVITSANILIRLCILGIGLWFQITQEPTIIETCTFYLVASVEITSLTAQITNLVLLKQILVLAESFNVFNRKLLKHTKINQKKKDGSEIYLKGFIILGVLICAVIFPTSFTANYFGYQIFKYITKGSIELSLITTGFMVFGFMTDWMLVYHYVSCAIIFAVCLGRFYKLCSWKQGLTPNQKYERLNMFRGLQIYNRYIFNEVYIKNYSLWFIGIGCTLMIIPTFELICYWEHLPILHLMLFGAIALITLLTTRAIIKLVNDMIDMSTEFIKSYQIHGKGYLTKYEELSFNCCKPIEMLIGDFERIRKETFPYLMQDIVLPYIIDLVLAKSAA